MSSLLERRTPPPVVRIWAQSLGAGDFPNNNNNIDNNNNAAVNDNGRRYADNNNNADDANAKHDDDDDVVDNNDITTGIGSHDNSCSKTRTTKQKPPPLNRTLTPATTTDSSSSSTTGSSEEEEEDDGDHDDDNVRWLGGEPCLLDATEEMEGVRKILCALSTQERKQMSDDIAMPVRHFRAEKGHTDLAIKKIKEALHWRRNFGLEELIQQSHHAATNKATTKSSTNGEDNNNNNNEVKEMLSRENDTGKLYVRGYDSNGRALLYMRPGRENTTHESNQMRHLVWNLEKAIACTAKRSVQLMMTRQQQQQGQQQQQQEENNNNNSIFTTDDKQPPSPPSPQPLEKVTLLIDYEGFSFRNMPPLSTSRYTLDILQKYYPERMHRAYILNPPAVFRTFWTIIRPFIDPVTKEKIVFCCSPPPSGRRRQQQKEKGGEGGGGGLAPLLAAVGDAHADKLEPVAGGTKKIRDFCSIEYLRLPFAVSFDE